MENVFVAATIFMDSTKNFFHCIKINTIIRLLAITFFYGRNIWHSLSFLLS
jgi:hypothetical protein